MGSDSLFLDEKYSLGYLTSVNHLFKGILRADNIVCANCLDFSSEGFLSRPKRGTDLGQDRNCDYRLKGKRAMECTLASGSMKPRSTTKVFVGLERVGQPVAPGEV